MKDAQGLFEKCVNLEPKDKLHREDLLMIKTLIRSSEELDKVFNEKDFKKAESLSESILQKCTEYSKIKQIYVESLIQNSKFSEVVEFVENKVGDDDDADMFNYYVALSKYKEGKYEESKKILHYLSENSTSDQKYTKLMNIINVIEQDKEKGNNQSNLQLMIALKKGIWIMRLSYILNLQNWIPKIGFSTLPFTLTGLYVFVL